MVDVRPTNEKLLDRAQRIVAEAASVGRPQADAALSSASGHAKTAVVMLLADVDAAAAADLLAANGDDVREAVARARP
jgi:N-acetylmuramic acid 6-phosphate etherase